MTRWNVLVALALVIGASACRHDERSSTTTTTSAVTPVGADTAGAQPATDRGARADDRPSPPAVYRPVADPFGLTTSTPATPTAPLPPAPPPLAVAPEEPARAAAPVPRGGTPAAAPVPPARPRESAGEATSGADQRR
jgi:hypothetical protein